MRIMTLSLALAKLMGPYLNKNRKEIECLLSMHRLNAKKQIYLINIKL
jgi:hypothetical protein